MTSKYFDKCEYYVENIWFQHDNIVYRGSGVLRWRPEKGFRLVAQMLGESRPSRKEFRAVELKSPLRMKLEILPRAEKTTVITPFLNIRDMALLFGQPFTINFRRAVFFRRSPYKSDAMIEKWFGTGLYEIDNKPLFPDLINKDIKVGDRSIGQSFSQTGFDYSGDDGEHIFGEIGSDEKYLEFSWSLPKTKWGKGRSWRFAQALQDALSIISGSVAFLRFHETYRGHRVANEFSNSGEPTSLGLIFRLFDFDVVPKDLVAHLAFFLSEPSEKERIIRKMFWQIVDASNQKSEGSAAILLSTVMEASLRTIYKIPFVPDRSSRDDEFKSHIIIKKFQADFLTGEHKSKWDSRINKIVDAYQRLRHRNAHPDWITEEDGMSSNHKMEQALNDTILLSRFYGYMILTLSGIKDLEPKFPVPFSNWKPIMTMETNSEKKSADLK